MISSIMLREVMHQLYYHENPIQAFNRVLHGHYVNNIMY